MVPAPSAHNVSVADHWLDACFGEQGLKLGGWLRRTPGGPYPDPPVKRPLVPGPPLPENNPPKLLQPLLGGGKHPFLVADRHGKDIEGYSGDRDVM